MLTTSQSCSLVALYSKDHESLPKNIDQKPASQYLHEALVGMPQ